ncbi:flavin reductase [Candidatus Sumerlaeota bacterium]|nr:flavin reductase [Candidatus Sumerlaeota bacterium]
MKEIEISKLKVDIVDLWMNQWLLLTAGNQEEFNMMTVAWGSIGSMWSKPFAQIVVRPQRHTYQFLEKSDSFTLCAFPEEYRKDLETLGAISGRDGDKLKKTKLTIRKSIKVAAPSYNEASLILECRKMYCQDIDPKGFIDPGIQSNYANRDYHRVYFGEILGAFMK